MTAFAVVFGILFGGAGYVVFRALLMGFFTVAPNEVAVIKSSAERTAAVEFARAGAVRPFIVGKAIQEISEDPEILRAVFEILETQKMLEGDVDLTLLPDHRNDLLTNLLAASDRPTDGKTLGALHG